MNLADLRLVLEVLMHHAESVHGIEKVDLDGHDCYWNIDTEDWFDLEKDPEVVVGSLSDDLSELHKLIDDPSRASTNDLDRLANLLRLLSYQMSKPT